MTTTVAVAEVSDPVRIHNALWTCFEEKRNKEIKIDGTYYIVRYHNTNSTHAARVEIDGCVWESQNMNKRTPNTEAIEDNSSIRISWCFYHNGQSISWLTKVESHDEGDVRHVEVSNLRVRPNEVVEAVDIPLVS